MKHICQIHLSLNTFLLCETQAEPKENLTFTHSLQRNTAHSIQSIELSIGPQDESDEVFFTVSCQQIQKRIIQYNEMIH